MVVKRLIDACGELRLILSNRWATVAYIAVEVDAGSDRIVSKYTVHHSCMVFVAAKAKGFLKVSIMVCLFCVYLYLLYLFLYYSWHVWLVIAFSEAQFALVYYTHWCVCTHACLFWQIGNVLPSFEPSCQLLNKYQAELGATLKKEMSLHLLIILFLCTFVFRLCFYMSIVCMIFNRTSVFQRSSKDIIMSVQIERALTGQKRKGKGLDSNERWKCEEGNAIRE